jgi:alpha-galactosidase
VPGGTADQFHQPHATKIIENILTDTNLLWEVVNIPNQGHITNLPDDAIVELPGKLNTQGVHGIKIGEMPEGIAELLRREITVSHLTVDAVVKGDRDLALQALLLDPVIRDIDVAQHVLDDYLVTYREHLPSFWK